MLGTRQWATHTQDLAQCSPGCVPASARRTGTWWDATAVREELLQEPRMGGLLTSVAMHVTGACSSGPGDWT